MNYIGSKLSLLGQIEAVLQRHDVPRHGLAVDLFSGTASVGQYLKHRGHAVYSNDWQRYSYVTAVALVQMNRAPRFGRLLRDTYWRRRIGSVPAGAALETYSVLGRRQVAGAAPWVRVLWYLHSIDGRCGGFYDTYCEGGAAGRLYYSVANGRRIQAIRDTVAEWSAASLLRPEEEAWLLACLLEGADRVANTASVYGAYLKRVKPTARQPLVLPVLEPVPSRRPRLRHRAFCRPGEDLLRDLQRRRPMLVYIDPPYNRRQYNANYHMLETIARWDLDTFAPRGVTGLRAPETQRSDYCMAGTAERAFRRLLGRVRSHYLLFSYNNEGLVPRDTLLSLIAERCDEVACYEVDFRRFRADVDGENRVYKANGTTEYLIFGRPR